MQHGRIPKSLHFASPNPHIAWSELPLRVASEGLDWPSKGEARIAGVSAFGISGTNAHVLIEEPPSPSPDSERPAAERSAELLIVSAPTEAGLRAVSERLSGYLSTRADVALGDVARSLATTRASLEQRLSLVVPTRQAAVDGLAAFARGDTSRAITGRASARGKVAWLFTGQGAQRLGMGQTLYDDWPAFRGALDNAFNALDPHLGQSLRSVMWAEPGSARAPLLIIPLTRSSALFAFEWALAALWRSWGVEPDFVAGHSIGELTAACVAGVFLGRCGAPGR